ncbi:MAG: sigma-70 family RNA polymerase sigma factor [Deltaproteobacteria bacterium]|nr:sigma-70 family RNA polymerase sigma factor [Nannocystaceae bacterium]
MDAVDSDDALLAASREGGREAFAKLVERYRDLVCALTFSATGNRALSEDLAQETFLAAWRGLPTLRDPGSFRGWLCTIARNLGRNARRDGSRELPTDPLPEHADELGLCDVLSEREEEALLWRALSELQDSYREPLVLFYREGKSAAEVAHALGLTVDAAEQRLSRGRRQLKAGVSSLVERALMRSRPGPGFVAAVVAAIGSETLLPTTALAATEAAASTARSTASWGATAMAIAWKTMVVGAAVTAITYGCMAWNERDQLRAHSADDVSRASAPAQDIETDASASKATPRSDAETLAETRQARERARQQRGELGLPMYQLTVATPKLAAVKLDGGVSELHDGSPEGSPIPPALPTVRTISGRVLDREGEPVEGAVVLAGASLSLFLGDSLAGQRGASTAADGTFELPMAHGKRVTVVALHQSGWSELGVVEEGVSSRSVELRLAEPARIEAALFRDGKAVPAALALSAVDRKFVVTKTGTLDAGVELEALPPGRYSASLRVQGEKGEAGAAETSLRKDIELVAGGTLTWDATLASGPTIAVLPKLPPDLPHHRLSYYKLAGHHSPTDIEQLRAQRRSGGASVWIPLGEEKQDVVEFRDVGPGPATFCVAVETVTNKERPAHERALVDLGFGCTTVDVDAKLEVQEVEVVVDPPSEAR